MAPAVLRPSPYLMTLGRLAIREAPTPDDSTTGPNDPQETNLVPPAYPGYNYPKWGIAVGTLCVAMTCVVFSFACAFLNRRNNKQVAFLAEFPCLDSKLHTGSGLATSTCAIPTALALSKYADEFGPATIAAEKISSIGTRTPFGMITDRIKMPRKVTRAFKLHGRGKVQQDVEGVPVGVDIVELKPVDLTSTLLDPKEEAKVAKDPDAGMFDWNRPEVKKEDGHIERPEPAIVPSSADVNADVNTDVDAIAFVTEERFENVDLNK